jgi:hypothetical protein
MMSPELDKALRCLYIAAEEPAAREVNRLARVEIEKLEAAVRDADKLLKAYKFQTTHRLLRQYVAAQTPKVGSRLHLPPPPGTAGPDR